MNAATTDPAEALRVQPEREADVVIVGAGPCGLTLANMLGLHGIDTVVIEANSALLDFPRGVGIDDEALRTFQAVGLVDRVLNHVVPNQHVIYLDSKRRELARMAPSVADYGWPRRNGFVQPLVDNVLYEGLADRPTVEVLWAHTVTGYSQDEDGVTVSVNQPDGTEMTIAAKFLVGCDGGRSMTRKSMGVAFDGLSSPTPWLVVDLRHDPLGTTNCYVGCDPSRPYISIGLPHGIRRFEFLLFDGEGEEMSEPQNAEKLIRGMVGDTTKIDILRARVYTHHARVASSFIDGRVMVAGDAAHLMPVWQGQGYNTGVRDSGNLGWKLAFVLRGLAGRELLETYDVERRPHAAAMVRLSDLTGRFLSPTNRLVTTTRDTIVRALRVVPPLRDYILQMRFKPMPRYTDGAVVMPPDAPPTSPIGRLFPQPEVMDANGDRMLLDDLVGPGFAVLQWGVDPRESFSAADLSLLRGLGCRFVGILPATQMASTQLPADDGELIRAGDVTGRLRTWFDVNVSPVLFLRPDRIVAAACEPRQTADTVTALVDVLHLTSDGAPTGEARGGASVVTRGT